MTAMPPAVAPGLSLGIDLTEVEVPCADFTIRLSGWQIPPGSCVAIIGPNGSGKSTIIETILGVRPAKRLVGGMLGASFIEWSRRPSLKQRLGVLMQNASLPEKLFVKDVVKLHLQLYGKASQAIVEALGVQLLLKKRYQALSRGERQRVDLMFALAHEPEIVFLDEPLTGLDQKYAKATCTVIEALQATTVVMACHTSQELTLSDKVAWIQRGELRMLDTPDNMRQLLVGDARLKASFVEESDAVEFHRQVMAEFSPQFTKATGPKELSVFGSHALSGLARSLVDDTRLDGLEFGRTNYSDLLYRCALGASDV